MLRYRADYRTLCFVASYFCVYLAAWFLIPFKLAYIIPTLLLLCCLNFMVAIIIHNTIHCPVFKNKTANKIFQLALTVAFGSPASGFVPGHNLSHHKHLQTAKDNTRTYKLRFKINFFNQLLFFFVMIPGILRTESRFVRIVGPTKPHWKKQYDLEVIVSWTWKIAWALIDWRMFLVYLIVPNVYAVWGIFGTNFWQHDGCDENHPYNHSRNFTGKLFNFLVCNNGYHGAHHMKPGLHWSLYPAYHQHYIAPHIHPNLDQKSLIVYLWRTLIYPAKRIDYLGNPLQLKPDDADQDWVYETQNTVMEAQEFTTEHA